MRKANGLSEADIKFLESLDKMNSKSPEDLLGEHPAGMINLTNVANNLLAELAKTKHGLNYYGDLEQIQRRSAELLLASREAYLYRGENGSVFIKKSAKGIITFLFAPLITMLRRNKQQKEEIDTPTVS